MEALALRGGRRGIGVKKGRPPEDPVPCGVKKRKEQDEAIPSKKIL